MNYLLIEERAWANLQAYARRLTDTMRRLDRHFNPAAESGWTDNAEVCRRLHISKRTLQYLRNSGKLPYSTLGNKCYYKPEDVRMLLDKNLTQLRITMDVKTMIENRSVLTRDMAEYEELLEAMRFAAQTADKLIAEVEPSLLGERYLTTEQVMTHFHISRRALQNYRDKGIIPYTSVGGTLLYPESKINEVLERNYYKPMEYVR